MNNVINDICTFSLSLFAIGMTIFTVIYSFISNKKEYLNEISDIILSGKAGPETRAKYKIAEGYIQRQKKYNRTILFISILSLVVYAISLLYLRIYPESTVLEYVTVFLFLILVVSFFLALSKFIVNYMRYVR